MINVYVLNIIIGLKHKCTLLTDILVSSVKGYQNFYNWDTPMKPIWKEALSNGLSQLHLKNSQNLVICLQHKQTANYVQRTNYIYYSFFIGHLLSYLFFYWIKTR
jgi:hypothetical protein